MRAGKRRDAEHHAEMPATQEPPPQRWGLQAPSEEHLAGDKGQSPRREP